MLFGILNSDYLYIKFTSFDLSPDNSFFYSLFIFLGIIMSISIHEFAHAIMAKWMGDDTASNLGRVTLNPFQHFDLIGFLLICFFPFGYGKPVPVNVTNFIDRKAGVLYTTIAGPLSNIILGVLCFVSSAFLARNFGFEESLLGTLTYSLLSLGYLNLFLAVFNLLPIPPLDGSNIMRVLSYRYEDFVNQYLYYPNNFFLLAVVIFSGILNFFMSSISSQYLELFKLVLSL